LSLPCLQWLWLSFQFTAALHCSVMEERGGGEVHVAEGYRLTRMPWITCKLGLLDFRIF
jgi:hypothetical protein